MTTLKVTNPTGKTPHLRLFKVNPQRYVFKERRYYDLLTYGAREW